MKATQRNSVSKTKSKKDNKKAIIVNSDSIGADPNVIRWLLRLSSPGLGTASAAQDIVNSWWCAGSGPGQVLRTLLACFPPWWQCYTLFCLLAVVLPPPFSILGGTLLLLKIPLWWLLACLPILCFSISSVWNITVPPTPFFYFFQSQFKCHLLLSVLFFNTGFFCVVLAGLEFKNPLASASWVLELKACVVIAS